MTKLLSISLKSSQRVYLSGTLLILTVSILTAPDPGPDFECVVQPHQYRLQCHVDLLEQVVVQDTGPKHQGHH